MDGNIQDLNDIINHAPNGTTQHKVWRGMLKNDSKEGKYGQRCIKIILEVRNQSIT